MLNSHRKSWKLISIDAGKTVMELMEEVGNFLRKRLNEYRVNISKSCEQFCFWQEGGQLWEFICDSVGRDVQCPRHVERNNYVPLFGVDPIECRLTLLRNT